MAPVFLFAFLLTQFKSPRLLRFPLFAKFCLTGDLAFLLHKFQRLPGFRADSSFLHLLSDLPLHPLRIHMAFFHRRRCRQIVPR